MTRFFLICLFIVRSTLAQIGSPNDLVFWDQNGDLISTNNAPLVFAGGTRSFVANSSVTGGTTAPGRTFVEVLGTNRLNKGGWINGVGVHVNGLGATTNGLKFKVLRPNGANWDIVSDSAVYVISSTGSNYISLSSPLIAREGDCVGVFVSTVAGVSQISVSVKDNISTPGIRYATGDATGNNVTLGSSLNANALDVSFYADSPVIGFTGDSITAGHNAGASWYPYLDSGSPITGTISSSYPYCWSTNGGSLVSYKNYAKGSETFQWVNVTAMPFIQADRSKVLWLMCGLNDVSTGWSWANVLTNLTAIRSKFTNSLFISEILPSTSASDSDSAIIRTWNTNLIAWALTNSSSIPTLHDAFGKIRVSTGQLDDLKTEYDQDGVHLTQAGVSNYVYMMNGYLKEVIISP